MCGEICAYSSVEHLSVGLHCSALVGASGVVFPWHRCTDGAGRRQLLHYRVSRRGGPCHLQQHEAVHPLPHLVQHRRGGLVGRAAFGLSAMPVGWGGEGHPGDQQNGTWPGSGIYRSKYRCRLGMSEVWWGRWLVVGDRFCTLGFTLYLFGVAVGVNASGQRRVSALRLLASEGMLPVGFFRSNISASFCQWDLMEIRWLRLR